MTTLTTTHLTGTRDEWLAARLELLQAEKELTHRSNDQRVHRNPVTLVTPTVRIPGAKSISGYEWSRTPAEGEKSDDDAQDRDT